MLDEIINVRRSIGDPVTSDFIVVDKLPDNPLKDTAYTLEDGMYQYHNGIDWQPYKLKFSDNYIEQLLSEHSRIRAAIKLIDNLIARIDPAYYLSAGNTGGQSMSFPSLAEVMAYYEGLRDKLLMEEAAEAGMDSGLMLNTKKKPVGGVTEYE